MAQIVRPSGAPAVPGPPLEGYTAVPTQAAVEGSNIDSVARQVGNPLLPGGGRVIIEQVGGSGAYGSLAGTDQILTPPQHAGVYGESDQQGVFGYTTAADGTGVYGLVRNAGFAVRAEASRAGTALSAKSMDNSGPAAVFEGTVQIAGEVNHTNGTMTIDGGALVLTTGSITAVKGDIVLTAGSITVAKGDITLAGADCAEDFDAAPGEVLTPGTVVVIGEDGRLRQSTFSYDKTVAGIISGAGIFQPGVTLGKQHSSDHSVPLALIGRVNCYVDADYMPIQRGDLLTTSPTPGHAMKANDPVHAFGAVLGKALAPLESGRQLVPVLVALQ
jgi:hypothetical protein